jgi:hypothetical protein
VRLPNNAFVLRTLLLAIVFVVVCAASGLAQTAPIADLPWLSLETEPGSNGEMGDRGGANVLKHLGDAPSTGGPTNQSGGFRLDVQTEKSLQTPQSMRRSECATTTEEECADYSGLPRSHPAHGNLKSLKKPFVGFSITSPLQ